MKLSAVVLVKNEAENLEHCLPTLKWCDEILVINDDSQDESVNIAKKQGAQVFQRKLQGNFAAQRNFALKKARGEWVLFVDADERVPCQLQDEIKQAIKSQVYEGYYLKRKDNFGGRQLKYGETGGIKLLRLARRKAGKWQRQVHEVWQINGKTTTLQNPLQHYPHQNMSEFITQINHYSTIHAQALNEEGKSSGLLKVVTFPLAKFVLNYVIKLGFFDGTPGLIVALMMSFHSFLAQSKLYLIKKKRS